MDWERLLELHWWILIRDDVSSGVHRRTETKFVFSLICVNWVIVMALMRWLIWLHSWIGFLNLLEVISTNSMYSVLRKCIVCVNLSDYTFSQPFRRLVVVNNKIPSKYKLCQQQNANSNTNCVNNKMSSKYQLCQQLTNSQQHQNTTKTDYKMPALHLEKKSQPKIHHK